MTAAVSIIIPAYNSAAFIGKAIDSILGQSFSDYQIIVVDDGSKDNTVEVLQAYGETITIISQANGGASRARNTGIQAATGEFVAFLDSDDLWRSQKLELQVKAMRENNDWVACYSETSYKADEEQGLTKDKQNATLVAKNLEQVFLHPYLVTSSFMVKRETLSQVGLFDERLETAEDIDLYLRVAEHGIIGQVQKSLVWKADIEGSLGSLLSSYQDNLTVVDSFLVRQTNRQELWRDLAKQVKAKIYLDWGKDLLWNQQAFSAMKVLFSSLKQRFRVFTLWLIAKAMVKALIKSKRG
ncbi:MULTISPECIES: glycosyltransferase family 2 protein [unclassified Agarivorans]|uniref:glycosyltransferase family 2 protein n=1 Tax=unclassified Agarivorans TaxID=2636026 RepID=UPI0026E23163|nr:MULTISPECIES: glycosyltransferase [unclassified Agarivorans]MDO6687744.1 glycosyltransferase [Agarivorans sp. 3_MG-2023]MDO6717255.1 glycosyltransferase [Agarivorans sp. 2_MG-2023]